MDAETLREAMGCSLGKAQSYVADYNTALFAAGCTTVNRSAMFAAQIGHESAGLVYMEEIASGAAYEGRRDLGNTQPGDGRRFKGRGPIQLTGRHNYGLFGQWCRTQGLVDSADYFTRNPTVVATSRWGFLAASWYWTVARPKINGMCDAGDLTGVTRAINGGTNGLADRRTRWDRCRRLDGRLLPSGGTPLLGPPAGTYVVQSGDVLSSIAAMVDVPWRELAAYNALADPDQLQLGQVLRIPGRTPAAAPPAPAPQPEEDDMPTPTDLWQHPIDDPYSPQPGDTQPAHVILAFLGANAAHAANASRAALTELAGLRTAVDRLAGAVGTTPGVEPAALQEAVRDGVAQALAESVRVEGSLSVAPHA